MEGNIIGTRKWTGEEQKSEADKDHNHNGMNNHLQNKNLPNISEV